jgi:hydrophobe/amphiphile efflux-1 (HAE1) family protein
VNFSEIFIRRPVATALLMAGLILLGILGYSLLPVSALPAVDFPTIEIRTGSPGAAPEVMAASVTTPLERQFGQISGLQSMTSVSSFGFSSIILQFGLDRDIDAAAQDVQAAINIASGFLPRNLPSPPVFSKVNPADPPILTLVVSSEHLPLEQVNDLADTILAQKLSQVGGVGLVTIQGNQKPAVRIRVDPSSLANLGLSMEDVRNAIASSNINSPKGGFDGKRQAFAIQTNDQIPSAAGFRPLVIAYKNGAPIRLSDVGDVIDHVENNKQGAWVGGKPSVVVDIQRQPGANIISTAERIKELLPQLRTSLPPSVRVSVLNDRTETIRASVHDVQFTLILASALVVLVIFLFLRKLWATVIPAVSLPLALIGTFGVMKISGFSLNNLSLMALTISTGFVVDDAIVMIENIVRYLEEGDSPMEAALKGSRQIGFTVISLSVSLVAVFIPLLFMQGIVGRLFREFALTLSAAVGVSAIVSLTLTPMMCSRLLKPERPDEHGKLFKLTESFFDWIRSTYASGLRWVLRHQTFTLLVTFGTLVATLLLYQIVPKGLLPQQDTGLILGITEAAPSTSFKAMSQHQALLAERVKHDPDVASVASFVGGSQLNPASNSGRLYIALKPRSQRTADVEQIMSRLRASVEDLPSISLFMQAVQDLRLDSRISRTQYQYSLQGVDDEELDRWASTLITALRNRPELEGVTSDQQNGGMQVRVDIDRSKANRLNVTTQAIDDTLYDAFGQRQVSVIFTQLNQYRVVLEAAPAFQLEPQALEKIFVKSTTGAMVPLSTMASLKTVAAPLTIQHQGQFPAVTLSFNLAHGSSLSKAVEAIESVKREIGLPDTISTEFTGSAAEFQASLSSTPWLLLAAIVVIYIVLGILYESYIHPVTILSSLPSAGVGALLALLAARMDLNLVGIIGIILLIGIVKKNAILMIDFALETERDLGLPPEESIYKACLLRFRPILMTTAAALLGALPLAFENGTGAELRKPLGVTIVGGLLLSQFLTLYTTPVIYLFLNRLSRRCAGWFGASQTTEAAPEAQPRLQ